MHSIYEKNTKTLIINSNFDKGLQETESKFQCARKLVVKLELSFLKVMCRYLNGM